MENTKLIEWLRRLSSIEFDDFILFVESPYHNKNTAVVPLIKYLRRYHPDLRGTKLTKAMVCRKINPPKIYKEARINVLMSQSLRLLEDFLTYETVKHNQLTFHRQQLIAYRDRNLDRVFTKSVEVTHNFLDVLKKDEDYHFAKYQVYREIFSHRTTSHSKYGKSGLQETLRHLDMFYAWEKIRLSVLAYNRKDILDEEYDFSLLEVIRQNFISTISPPVLRFMSDLIDFWEKNDKELFSKLCFNYERLFSDFTNVEKHNYLQLLLNFGIRLYRRGNYEVVQSILLMYKLGIKSKLVYQNGNIKEGVFFSICSSFCENDLIDEGEKFVDEHEERIIPKENQKDAFQLGMAMILFHKALKKQEVGLFDKTIDYLVQIHFSSPEYTFRVKSMQLRIYYEIFLQKTDSHRFIEDFTKSFELQIMRNKTLSYKKKSYLSLAKIVRKLIYFYNKPSEKLKKEILHRFNLHTGVGKKWLSEKIEEAQKRAPC